MDVPSRPAGNWFKSFRSENLDKLLLWSTMFKCVGVDEENFIEYVACYLTNENMMDFWRPTNYYFWLVKVNFSFSKSKP